MRSLLVIALTLCVASHCHAQIYNGSLTAASPITLPIAGAVSGYSMIKVSGSSANCVQVTRADGTTQDIGYVNNVCDKVSADTFANGTALTISKEYDQIGTSDLVNATQATQPTYTNLNEVRGIRPVSYSGITSNSAKFLQAPISVNRNSFTMYMVIAPRVSFASNSYFELSDAGFTTSYLNMTTNFGPLNTNAGGVVKTTTIYPRSHVDIISYSSSSTNQIFRVNGVEQSFAQASSQVVALLTVGKIIFSANYNSLNDEYARFIYSVAHTSIQMQQTEAVLQAAFNTQTLFTNRLVYGGSSLIVSWFSTSNQQAPWQGGFGRGIGGWETYVMAVGGQTLATECTTNLAALQSLYDSTKAKNVAVLDAPSNDIANNGSFANSAAAIAFADNLYNNTLVPCITALKTTGFTVDVPTIIARSGWVSGSGNFYEDARIEYNLDVVSGAGSAYVLSDRASNSLFASPAATSNSNCYASDGIHLINTQLNCYRIMESYDKAAILH